MGIEEKIILLEKQAKEIKELLSTLILEELQEKQQELKEKIYLEVQKFKDSKG